MKEKKIKSEILISIPSPCGILTVPLNVEGTKAEIGVMKKASALSLERAAYLAKRVMFI